MKTARIPMHPRKALKILKWYGATVAAAAVVALICQSWGALGAVLFAGAWFFVAIGSMLKWMVASDAERAIMQKRRPTQTEWDSSPSFASSIEAAKWNPLDPSRPESFMAGGVNETKWDDHTTAHVSTDWMHHDNGISHSTFDSGISNTSSLFE